MSNDAFADATAIIIPTTNVPVSTAPVSNVGYSNEGTFAPGSPVTGYRDAWYSYHPGSFGECVADTSASTAGVDYRIDVYTGADVNHLTAVTSGLNEIDTYLAYDQYWIRVSTTTDVDATYVLTVNGAQTPGDGTAMQGHVEVDQYVSGNPDASVQGQLVGFVDMLEELTGTLTVQSASFTHGTGRTFAPTLIAATILLVAPKDGVVVPGQRPIFTVEVITQQSGLTVVIEYDKTGDFASPTTLTAPISPGQTVIRASVQAAVNLLDDTTYFWRASLRSSNDTLTPTAARSFSVNVLDGDAAAGGTWEVTTGTGAAPHLWFAHPARARAGDPAIAIGTGFGPNHVTVTIAGKEATVTGFTDVPPTTDAYTGDRQINAATGRVDPGHQKISFIVPDAPTPGGVLYVDGN